MCCSKWCPPLQVSEGMDDACNSVTISGACPLQYLEATHTTASLQQLKIPRINGRAGRCLQWLSGAACSAVIPWERFCTAASGAFPSDAQRNVAALAVARGSSEYQRGWVLLITAPLPAVPSTSDTQKGQATLGAAQKTQKELF